MKTNRKTLLSIGLCFVLLFAIGLTGCSEDDPVSPMDPINLVFKSQVDPFNLPWTDALGGDVHHLFHRKRLGRTRHSNDSGPINAAPIDIQTYEPIGDPFDARVSGKQNSMHNSNGRMVKSVDRRLALQQGEPELFFEILQVGSVPVFRNRAF